MEPTARGQVQILPETEEQALDNGLWMLRELEYRSARAAYMNYYESNLNEWGHLGCSVVLASSTSILAVLGKDFVKSYIFKTSERSISDVLLGVTVWLCTYFGKLDEYVMPYFEKKTERHNKAGAAWQRLELKIISFLSTTTQASLSQRILGDTIDQFAEKREEICNIARPSNWLHKWCERKPDFFVKMKKDLVIGVEGYFDESSDDRDP